MPVPVAINLRLKPPVWWTRFWDWLTLRANPDYFHSLERLAEWEKRIQACRDSLDHLDR